jgi:hypothetical protein
MNTKIKQFSGNKKFGIVLSSLIALIAIVYFALPQVLGSTYTRGKEAILDTPTPEEAIPLPPKPRITHVSTPAQVKAIYMSSWVAGTPSFREKLVGIADRTEINTIVIDIKDYTGKIAFEISDPSPILEEFLSIENRIPDIVDFLNYLHDKNIYVIGRVAVFQDPHLVKVRPDLAVKKLSDKNVAWADRKGMKWLDTGSKEAWDYVVEIGKASHAIGFDEINFDYIRFPSDGNMKDIYFPISQLSESRAKHDVVREFYEYLHASFSPLGIPISGDLFGMTTTVTDDMNIGQILEDGLRNFDYVAPMVYPSHYPPTWNGFKNPAANPYEVIQIAMKAGVDRAIAIGVDPKKLRPWLQDFDMGATYTPDMVRAQIKATYDVGLDSWMLWDPGNTYTEAALEK